MCEKILNVTKNPNQRNKQTNKQENKQTSWLSFVQLCSLPTCVFNFDSVQIHYNTKQEKHWRMRKKNGRKPYLFPQKKVVSVFYAINILTLYFISIWQTFIVRRENAFCKFQTFFRFCLPCFLITLIWNKK